MMTFNDLNNSKNSYRFECRDCIFYSNNKNDFNRHCLTTKHKKLKMNDLNDQKTRKNSYECECGKIYKYKQGLSAHKKKCNDTKESFQFDLESNNLQELVIKLITDNQEMKKENQKLINTLVGQQQQICELIPKIGNNNINNTINNKHKFNINVFLNEQCKDALTMNEFIDKIRITIDDLMITKNKGLAEGVSNIFIENMNKLSFHERPIHCTDIKRETMYIKCDGNIDGEDGGIPCWVKDRENIKIKQVLRKISHAQQKGLQQWVEKHPNWENNQDEQEEYLLLINKCTSDLLEDKREEKIIKKLCNEVYIKGENT